MVKAGLVLTGVAAALALPAAQGMATPRHPAAAVEQSLLRRMNSSPDGRITRRVVCGRGSKAGVAFSCELESVRSTKLRADIVVVGGALRTAWEPLAG